MKNNLFLIIGIALLAFTTLGYFGNFVQWSDAQETTAKILSSEKQWLRRGEGNINLEIQYAVDGNPRNGTASVAASTLEEAATEDEIQVYYMKKNPNRVIPVAVLKGKQKTILYTLGSGILLTLIGVVVGIRKKSTLTVGA